MSERPNRDDEDEITPQIIETAETLDQAVISVLREKGPTDSQYQELMALWLAPGDTLLDEAKTGMERRQITTRRELELAQIYLAAGYEEEGLRTLVGARKTATDLALYKEVQATITSIMLSYDGAERIRMEALLVRVKEEYESEMWSRQ